MPPTPAHPAAPPRGPRTARRVSSASPACSRVLLGLHRLPRFTPRTSSQDTGCQAAQRRDTNQSWRVGGDGGGLLRRDGSALRLPNEQGTAGRGSWPGRVCHRACEVTNSTSPAGRDTAWTWLEEHWRCVEQGWRAALLRRLCEDQSSRGQAGRREAREEAAQ